MSRIGKKSIIIPEILITLPIIPHCGQRPQGGIETEF